MRYVGGKIRQARGIERVVQELRGDRGHYTEPFAGGCAVTAVVAPHFVQSTAGDMCLDLILFWRAVRGGWRPPAEMSREEYEALRLAEPSPLRAWAGFAASYNGKWWGGYGPQASGRDYLAESLRAVEKKAIGIAGVSFIHQDYAEAQVSADTVVYADPPYEGTLEYGATRSFDYSRFWRTMTEWVDLGAVVLVSEYTAPDGWRSVLNVQRVETMNHGGPSSGARVEGLWTR